MAKIPLRHYNREIETLIDRGQTEEAIAHCRHILQTYPKYIESYRLLGKAYLESQRFGEAADVFQRVLACIPDDFVAQIGMSIIREDEGNLDAAIWHMERAYEVQPANAAIQGELRRLYGRRDGLEPPKIRLTRGALARMYARGDLYQQAIAESQAAMAEEPNRPDLQALMARMYALSGQKVEAAELCTSLLAKYPYCLEANRILAQILPGTARAQDSQVYQQRVIALEPYLGLLPTDASDLSEVPDQAVLVQRLDWNPLEGAGISQPQWAESLGINVKSGDEQQVPEWLSDPPNLESRGGAQVFSSTPPFALPLEDESPVEPVDTLLPDLAEAKHQDDTLIPEWMKEAGWSPSDGTIPEQQVVFDDTEPAVVDEATAAEIPDWLKEMAPVEPEAQQPPQQPSLSEATPAEDTAPDLTGIPDWLSSMVDQPEEKTEPGSTVFPFAGAEATSLDTPPDWLGEFEVGDETGSNLTESSAEPASVIDNQEPILASDVPEWIREQTQQETEQSSGADSPPPDIAPEPDQEAALPWLESLAARQDAAEEVLFTPAEDRTDTPPDWIQEMGSELSAQAVEPASDQVQPEPENQEPAPVELPAWLHASEISRQQLAEQPAEAQLSLDEAGDLPEWISQMESVTGEETVDTSPRELPSWLSAIEGGENDSSTAAQPAREIPDWLEDMKAVDTTPFDHQAAEQTPEPITEDVEPEGTVPDWLQEPQEDQPETLEAVQEEIIEEPISPPVETIPEWLQEFQTSTQQIPDQSAPLEVESLVTAEPEPSQPATSQDDQDAALAWLESLAAKQGADEEVLFTRPEDRFDTPPEWVQEAQEGENDQPSTSSPGTVVEPPAWLKEEELIPGEEAQDSTRKAEGFPSDQEPTTEEPSTLPGDELPTWLKDLKSTPFGKTVSGESAEGTGAEDEQITSWLQDLETQGQPLETGQEITEEAVPSVTDNNLPDWIQENKEPDSEPMPVQTSEMFPVNLHDTDTPVVNLVDQGQEDQADGPGQSEQAAVGEPAAEFLSEDKAPPEYPVAETITIPDLTPDELAELEPVLSSAKSNMNGGQVTRAIQEYDRLIQSGSYLEETIRDLRDALYRYPVDIAIWEKLGDAYARSNRLQEALDAYTKAEELLR